MVIFKKKFQLEQKTKKFKKPTKVRACIVLTETTNFMTRILLILFFSCFCDSMHSQCVNVCGDDFIQNGDLEIVNEPDCSSPLLSAQLLKTFPLLLIGLARFKAQALGNFDLTPDYLSPNCNFKANVAQE